MNVKKIASLIFATITVDISSEDYNAKEKQFVFELSDKDLAGAPMMIRLKNPKTGKTLDFERIKGPKGIDYADPSHEDIAGYHYKNIDGNYKLLIIND